MSFETPRNKAELPVDKLERDPLPPDLETAQAEYFADMAFDDRLLLLLEDQPTSIHIAMNHKTTEIVDGLASQLFHPNDTEAVDIALDDNTVQELYMPAFNYRLSGLVQKLPTRLVVDATVTPSENINQSVRIQSNNNDPDSFFVSLAEGGDNFGIDSVQLLYILCQLGGASAQSVDTLYDSLKQMHLDKPSIIQKNIEEIWQQLGETHGTVTAVTELRHKVEKPVREDFPEFIKLRREEEEHAHSTVVRLYLEHATEMTNLDVESSYCLKLTFEQTTERSVEKNAERVVVSGIATPRLVGLDFSRKLKGRVTPLDLDTVAVKELFINWFDQIVSD